MKLVMIEWLDSYSGHAWQTLETIEKNCQPIKCRSVGWLLCRRNRHIVIVPHLSAPDDERFTTLGNGEMAIPEAAVVKMSILKSK